MDKIDDTTPHGDGSQLKNDELVKNGSNESKEENVPVEIAEAGLEELNKQPAAFPQSHLLSEDPLVEGESGEQDLNLRLEGSRFSITDAAFRNLPTPASTYSAATRKITQSSRFNRYPTPLVSEKETPRNIMDRIHLPLDHNIKMISTERIFGVVDGPPGFGASKSFLIYQQKPKPLTPLKAWRGYHGNVYFEPVHVLEAPSSPRPGYIPHLPHITQCSPSLVRVVNKSRWNPEHVLRNQQHQAALYDSCLDYAAQINRIRNKRMTERSVGTCMVHLDKDQILHSQNAQAKEVHLLKQAQSTGSLRVPSTDNSPFNSPDCPLMTSHTNISRHVTPSRMTSRQSRPEGTASEQRSRVCRGSVSRRLLELRQIIGVNERGMSPASAITKSQDSGLVFKNMGQPVAKSIA